jgi:hypothetical protein
MDYQAFRRKLDEEEARSVVSTETRPFWCVAWEEWNRRAKRWELAFNYSHADTMAEARMTFCRARCDPYGRVIVPYNIIGIAQVIGVKALDDNGTKLVA